MATKTTGVGPRGEDGSKSTSADGAKDTAQADSQPKKPTNDSPQLIPLVEKPATSSDPDKTTEIDTESQKAAADAEFLHQETVPMPAVTWPPPVPEYGYE